MPGVARTRKGAVGALDRLRRAADADLAAYRTSKNAALRREAAATPAEEARRIPPPSVAHRLQALANEQQRIRRRLERGRLPESEAAQLEARTEALREQSAYWAAIRQEQIAQGIATDYGRIRKGDDVRWRGRWHCVLRANATSVTVESPWGPDTIPNHELSGHRPAQPGPVT